MTARTVRTMTLAAGAAWLVVAASGVQEAVADDGSDWELAYAIFTVALVLGAALSVAVAARLTDQADRPKLRAAGLVVAALGGVFAVLAAWALPVWMFLLGVGFGLVAAAARRWRRPLAVLATVQLAGIVVLIAGIEAEIGRRDSYGDYPVAGGIAIGFVALATVGALLYLAAQDRRAVTTGAAASA